MWTRISFALVRKNPFPKEKERECRRYWVYVMGYTLRHTKNSFKVLDIHTIHSLSIVTFMGCPELAGTFQSSPFVCVRCIP